MLEGGLQAGDGGDQRDGSSDRADQDEVPAVEFDGDRDGSEKPRHNFQIRQARLTLFPPRQNLQTLCFLCLFAFQYS